MNRIRTGLLIVVAAMLPMLSAAQAAETVVDRALGADGHLVSLLGGTYGDLFPAGTTAGADEPVLALHTSYADGGHHREVVPATLDFDREDSGQLVVEPETGMTFVFWQSWRTDIHSNFRVASFDGTQWGEPIDIAGSSWSWKLSPAFAVTHDSYNELTSEGEAGGKQVNRTVLHVIWLEEADEGRWHVLYAPLVLVDGRYIDDHPVLVLNDLVTGENAATASDLRIPPVVRPSNGEHAVIAAFFDQGAGELMTVELALAAGELSALGDVVAGEIDKLGPALDGLGKSEAVELVDVVTTRVLAQRHHLKPEVLNPLAENLATYLQDRLEEGREVRSVFGEARPQLVDFGFRMTDGRLHRVTGNARPQLVDFGARQELRRGGRQDLRLTVVSRRTLPPDATVAPEILVGSGGQRYILAWRDQTHIRYQESKTGGGWSGLQQINFTDQFDVTKAMAVLQRRVDQQ